MADARVRSELMWCCCIGVLMHTNLRAQLSSWECSWNEQGADKVGLSICRRRSSSGGWRKGPSNFSTLSFQWDWVLFPLL